MNDPELDQLPTTDMSARTEQLEQLKQLAEREHNAAEPQLPSHYALSMAELKAQRAKQAAATQAATATQAAQATLATANQATENQEPEKQKITFAGTRLQELAQLFAQPDTLPTAATMLEELGAELGITVVTAAVAKVLRAHHEQASAPVDPYDRFAMFEYATQLRKGRMRWDKILEQVNEAGYRNRKGGLWNDASLRRALDRECARRGISLSKMGRRK